MIETMTVYAVVTSDPADIEYQWYVVSADGRYIYGPYAQRTPLFARQAAETSLRLHQERHPDRAYRLCALAVPARPEELKSTGKTRAMHRQRKVELSQLIQQNLLDAARTPESFQRRNELMTEIEPTPNPSLGEIVHVVLPASYGCHAGLCRPAIVNEVLSPEQVATHLFVSPSDLAGMPDTDSKTRVPYWRGFHSTTRFPKTWHHADECVDHLARAREQAKKGQEQKP